MIAVWVVATGALHLDGLADCADAWVGGFGDRKKTLRILKDSRVGPIAVVALVVVLLLKWSAVAAMVEQNRVMYLWLIPVMSRTAMIVAFQNFTYISKEGLGSVLVTGDVSESSRLIVSHAITGILLVSFLLLNCCLLGLVGLAIYYCWQQSCANRLGGFNGDCAGALLELLETGWLVSGVIFYEFSRVTAIVVLTALFLDFLLGEPRRGHPLVAFGRAATFTENRFQQFSRQGRVLKWLGLFACCLLIAIPVVLLWLLLAHLSAWVQSSWVQSPWSQWLVETAVLYFVVGLRSLREHAMAVVEQLQAGDLSVAREEVSRIVSRDTSNLTEQGVATARLESVLENGSDGVLAPIFWYLVGCAGCTFISFGKYTDAMWGYRNQRYLHFGWAAAKLDDAMNWIPARLTAMSYALMGDFPQAIQCMKTQGAADR